MENKQISVEVWGANAAELLNFPGLQVEFLRWQGCDTESCEHFEHDPINKVYRVTFPHNTKIAKAKAPMKATDYTLPDGTMIRIMEGGHYYDKVQILPTKGRKAKELTMGLG